jgi:hypothetical protein
MTDDPWSRRPSEPATIITIPNEERDVNASFINGKVLEFFCEFVLRRPAPSLKRDL